MPSGSPCSPQSASIPRSFCSPLLFGSNYLIRLEFAARTPFQKRQSKSQMANIKSFGFVVAVPCQALKRSRRSSLQMDVFVFVFLSPISFDANEVRRQRLCILHLWNCRCETADGNGSAFFVHIFFGLQRVLLFKASSLWLKFCAELRMARIASEHFWEEVEWVRERKLFLIKRSQFCDALIVRSSSLIRPRQTYFRKIRQV